MRIFTDFFRAVGAIASEFWSVSPFIFIMLCVTVLCFLIFLCLGLRSFFADVFPPRPPTVESRIGYKRAWLKSDSFRGVLGIPYNVDESTNGRGFHAYYSFSDAFNHPQDGNVYLEVLLSGDIREHDLGYIASHQRVLQVIAGDCRDCNRPATNYWFDPEDGAEAAPVFLCRHHARLPNRVKPIRAFQRLTNRLLNDDFDEPIEELANDFPWLAHAGVISAPHAGPKAFIPTKLSPKSELAQTQ